MLKKCGKISATVIGVLDARTVTVISISRNVSWMGEIRSPIMFNIYWERGVIFVVKKEIN